MIGDRVLRWLAKTLYERYPDLMYRVPLLRSWGSQAGEATGFDYQAAAAWYEANVWVRRAITRVAETFAPLPLAVWSERTNRLDMSHPLALVFQHVNAVDDPISLWTQYASDWMLYGEAALELVTDGRGRYGEVWARAPQTVYVRLESGAARRYGGLAGYRVEDGLGPAYTLDPAEMVFCKTYNPLNPWRGLSPVMAIRLGIQIDEFSRLWSRNFFRNSARPALAILAPQGMTRGEKQEIERRFVERYGGMEQAHGVIALEEGVTDVKPIDYSPVDTEWLEQRQFSRTEIAAMYGVPEEIMGFGKDTYENFQTALKVFYLLTIVPLAQARDSRLTEFFRGVGALRPGEKFETDFSGVEVLHEARSALIADARSLWEMGTPANQAFEFVGMPLTIPDGDAPRMERPSALPVARARQVKAIGFGSPEHVRIMEHKAAVMTPFESRLMRGLRAQFRRQAAEVAARLEETRLAAGMAVLKQSPLVDVAQEMATWRAEFEPVFAEAVRAAGLDAFESLGLELAFDLDRPEVRAAVDATLAAFAQKVNDTTFAELGDLFRQAEQDGWTIEQIMERLGGYWADRTADYQLERIARTTLTTLNNVGDEAAWGQTQGSVIGSEWLAALDHRTRDAHRAAHGQRRRLGQMFFVGGEYLLYPGDVNGAPENVINCRCSRAPVLAGEAIEE